MSQLKGLIDDTLENLGIDPEDLKAKKHDAAVRSLPPRDGQAPASDSSGEPAAAQSDVEMRADGGYDSREVFSYCDSRGITPYIQIRTNAGCRAGAWTGRVHGASLTSWAGALPTQGSLPC